MHIKKNRIILFILTFLTLTAHAKPEPPQSRSLVEHFPSPAAMGYGGIALPYSPIESSSIQPSYLAHFERNGGSLGFAFGDNLFGGYGLFFISSNYGTFGLGTEVYSDSIDGDIEKFVSLKTGYGRKVTKSFGFGIYFFPVFLQNKDGYRFGFGISPGLTYDLQLNWTANGFGLHDLNFSLLGRNISAYLGKGDRPKMAIHGGIHSTILNLEEWRLTYGSELSFAESDTTIRLHQGMGLGYRWFSLRFGYIHSDQSQFKGPTMGAGFDFPITNGNLTLDYAYLPKMEGRPNVHFISAGGSFGYIDKTPPKVSLKIDSKYFSPNVDGIKDNNHFHLSVSDYSPIKSWELIIRNSEGKIVRVFENDKRDFNRGFSFTHFVSKFFPSDTVKVPRKIRWDGTGERISIEKTALQSNSLKVIPHLPDGKYYYELSVTDERNNKSKPKRGNVFIDNTPPEIQIVLDKKLFSPNDDGNMDTLEILQEPQADARDFWNAWIENSEGEKIKTFSWNGQEIPTQITWSGKNNENIPAPEGIYRYVIEGKDLAGNKIRKQTQEITMVRKLDVVSLELASTGFSPNNDGIQDEILIKTIFPNKDGIENWSLNIYNGDPSADNLVRSFSGDGQSIPESIIWDGNSDNGKSLADDDYNLLLSANYETGNSPKSFIRKIILDKTPPILSVEAGLDIFSPDGDGQNETQSFTLDITDENKIFNYTLEIFEVQYNDKNIRSPRLFKKFTDKKWPEKIFWDGKSDIGNVVESATIYEYKLSATDEFGNIGKSQAGVFETDILVLVTDRGLKVRLSNIEFSLGRATLRSKSKKLLRKLSRLLNRYPNYKIKVEGHTDDIGKEDSNLRLSELRARSVMKFLIRSGIAEGRIGFQGLGETQPLLPNTSWYNRSRNRRVEFLLIK